MVATNYYVDPAATPVTGLTTADAFTTTFNQGAWTGGDFVWQRRASTLIPLTAASDFNTTAGANTIKAQGVNFIAWPNATEEYYSTRPVGGQAAWDGDAATKPGYTYTGTTASFTMSIATNCNIQGLQFTWTGAGTWGTGGRLIFTSASSTYTNLKYCSVSVGSAGVSGNGFIMATTSSFINVISCTFSNAISSASQSNAAMITGVATAYFADCTFTTSGTGAGVSAFGLTAAGFGTFDRCLFQNTSVNENNCFVMTSGGASFSDCTCDCSTGTSGVAQAGSSGVTLSIGAVSTVFMQNMTVLGRLAVTANVSIMHFAKVQQYRGGQTYAMSFGLGTYLVDQFLPATSTTPGGRNTNDIALAISGINVFLGNVVWGQTEPNIITGAFFATVFSADEGGVPGSWKCRQVTTLTGAGNYNTMNSSSVYRTGGEPGLYSIQFQQKYPASGVNPFCPLDLSIAGMETIIVPLVSGANTITVYGGYKGYTNAPTTQEVWFDLTYYTSASDATKATASSQSQNTGGSIIAGSSNGQALTADGSTWVGDTLTSFKMAITITTGRACNMPVRIMYLKQDSNGTTYIDPLPKVT